eukprot:TRINITY_DN79_c0_g1_i2.p1 TRINITY_DN79_c0_g1~~TRINITY_DN79_c0_g1_i2.p1  ORF type:complete len:863 (-),score=435.32 TRINITY_DN79_c0_g1_i2:168-2489(-)
MSYDGFSVHEKKLLKDREEKYEFQAEVSRMMDIIIKYLYSNKDVFLRELVSNASDALDKIRFLSLTDAAQLGEGDQAKLEIRIWADKERQSLTIRDTGVGMTKEELVKNLGTIAKSGTTQFVDAMTKGGADNLNLIGQFGVGFYSVYLVADSVTVISKSNNSDKQWVWESNAQGSFSIAEDPRGNTLGRGTEITLSIKEDAKDYLDFSNLKRIAGKYSEFINFPIYLKETKTVEKEVPVEEEAKEEKVEEKKEDEVEVKDEEKKEEKPKTKKVSETVTEWHLVNEHKPIWTRSPREVTQEEYDNFYKSLTKDTEKPLAHVHFSAEGDVAFKALLYIPSKAPFDLYDKYYGKSSSLKLYVRRVLIADEFEDFMPRWLNFIKGVVDSDDLPLNVNRETLQKSKLLQVIGKKLVNKAFDMLKNLAEKKAEEEVAAAEGEEKKDEKKAKEEPYLTFYKQFGKSIKLGLVEDHQRNGKKLQRLLRFETNKSPEKALSLMEYVERMKPKQENIFYVAGENKAAVLNSPFLEKLNKKGLEVLFLTEPLDEYAIGQVAEFEGKKLQSITKEGLNLGGKSKIEKYQDEFKELCKYLEGVYGTKVEKVVVSNRVASAPAVLVTGQYGWSANMERIMRAQALGDLERAAFMFAKRTLEINPKHPIVQELKARVAGSTDDARLKDLALVLYDAAALNSGFQMDQPKEFGERLYRLMASNLNLSTEFKVEEDDDDEEEDVKEDDDDDDDDDDEETTSSSTTTAAPEAAPAAETAATTAKPDLKDEL